MGTLKSWDDLESLLRFSSRNKQVLEAGIRFPFTPLPFVLLSPVVLYEQSTFCSKKSELVSCHFFHICFLYLGSPNPHTLDLQFPHTSLQHLTDF